MIYFILNKNLNHIKIGYSKNPYKRIKTFETSNSNELEIVYIIDGNISLEKRIHKFFVNFNIKNEWFVFSKEIENFIYFLSLGNNNEKYIINYFNLNKYDEEILLDIFKLWLVIENYFGNIILEDYSIFFENNITLDDMNLNKNKLIKLIFDKKIQYDKLLDFVLSNKIE